VNFSYAELQECLFNWPNSPIPEEKLDDSLLERIRQVLIMGRINGVFSKSDIMPLIRHFLLRESASSGQVKSLRVPAAINSWPSSSEWNMHGISAMSIGHDSFLLTANPWHPTWMGGGSSEVFVDVFLGNSVREEGRCPVDPFIGDFTGYEYYSSPGQREAVRGAFLMPPGGTLIVNLPTGSGKSLVGQVPALVHSQDGHLTIFVVPTVALAIDQARQMKHYLCNVNTTNQTWPLAWYGNMKEGERSEIRRRLREGTQRILFVSPEALTTSLLRAIFEVSSQGMLDYLVIDEAHLITQWGDEFRPSFQALAGVRNSLLKESRGSSFRTLLLSATFTPETIDTLVNLFGPSECVQMVAAVHLRPEPQYWFSRAISPEEKKKRVLEVLRHAPRPFILYVTERKDALDWHNILRNQLGFMRVERFDGETPNAQREKIIGDWVGNKLDGIVATSAFGVGIDKSDVRTIIHASIPETLDRFYQEVGRGGRDGKPSISLLIYDDSDWALPRRMAKPKIISDELGFARWRALFDTRIEDANGDFQVNLEALRQNSPGGKSLLGSSSENVNWNMRTLLLMSRAGFLELHVEPNSTPEIEIDDIFPSSPLAAMSVVKIRLLRHDHLLPEVWKEEISLSRNKTVAAGARNLFLMEGILVRGQEVSETLAELYRNNSKCWSVDVTKVCGGCPSDRFCDTRTDQYHVPIAAPIHNVQQQSDLSLWESTFPYLDPRYVNIFYEQETPLPVIVRFVKWLVCECGVQELCADARSGLGKFSDWRQMYRYAPNRIVIHRNFLQLDEEPYSPLGRVSFLDTHVAACEIKKVLLLDRPMHFVLCPSKTVDPDYPLRFLSDTATNSVRLDQLMSVINQ